MVKLLSANQQDAVMSQILLHRDDVQWRAPSIATGMTVSALDVTARTCVERRIRGYDQHRDIVSD